jgi:hypothetical protein
LACACTVLGSLVFAIALMTAGTILDEDTLQASAIVAEIAQTVILLTIIAGSILAVGMWYHALRPGGLESNPLWILALFLLALPGTMLYYALRYRRSVKQASPDATRTAATAGR